MSKKKKKKREQKKNLPYLKKNFGRKYPTPHPTKKKKKRAALVTKISLWVIRTIIRIMSKQNQKHNLPDYKTSDAATRGQKTRAAQLDRDKDKFMGDTDYY